MIDRDVTCRSCGYNLRGRLSNALCSECGEPAANSLRSDQLCYTSPAWLKRVASGVRISMLTLIWGFAGGLLIGIAFAVLSMARLVSPSDLQVVVILTAAIVQIINQRAAYMISTPEPGMPAEAPTERFRKLIRRAIIPMLVSVMLGQVHMIGPFSSAVMMAVYVVSILLICLGIAVEYAKLKLYAHLAGRIPDQILQRRADFLKYAFVISMAAQQISATILAIYMLFAKATAPLATLTILSGAFVSLMGLAMLVFGILYAILLVRLARAMRFAGEMAESLWTSSPTSGTAAFTDAPVHLD